MLDTSSLLTNLRSRYNPDGNLLVEGRMYSELSGVEKDTAKYIKAAMCEVDSTYTQITLDAGNAVKTQLNAKQHGISYEFQGSVMTQTHIRGVSDIDLLTLTNEFEDTELTKVVNILDNYSQKSQYSWTGQQRLQKFYDDFSRYTGDSDQVLMQLRLDNEAILKAAGLTMSQVVKTTVFLSDMDNFAAMNSIYAEFFTIPYPARSAVAIKTLPKGALVEIEVVAQKAS